jgi:transcriptional regulator with XRE-family HTH domain
MGELEQETLADIDPIGNRLKSAREAQGMSLDDVAAKTRVPIRHLQHMEKGEWEALPAPTYSVGFARAYASAVGLNASEIGSELRAQLGAGQKIPAQAALYEPADPARVPPQSLAIIAGIIAILLIGGYLIWRSATVDDDPLEANEIAALENSVIAGPANEVTTPLPPAPAAAAPGTVTIAANDEAWLRVYEKGGRTMVEKVFKAGETYQVPATANQPQLITARPNALRVTVGSTAIPTLGPPERTIDVSLAPADLLARTAPASAPPAPAAARPQRKSVAPTRSSVPAPTPAPAPAASPGTAPPAETSPPPAR